MNNERLRNRDLIAMHLRPGGGPPRRHAAHDGGATAKPPRRELDAFSGATREAARD